MINTYTKSEPQKGFIPALEGMRALAVIAVLLYHLDFEFVSGGYLGVDLFFLISGYIISRNILHEVRNGTFSLGTFYYRRFRRLLPALIVTVLLTMLLGYFVIPPEQLALSARSAVYSLFSIGNVNFWLESGYFDSSAHSKPLLHTWSLGVEEQFYLFWPLLLVFCFARERLLFAVCTLLVSSVFVSMLAGKDSADAVFYLLPFRVHQFMAGALVACVSFRFGAKVGTLVFLIALSAIFYSFVVSGPNTFVLYSAVWISIFGALLLFSMNSKPSTSILGNRLMVWIGSRSYAIYLVHWPVIVLWKYWQGFELSITDRVLLFAVSVVAAVVLHVSVEKPFRVRGSDGTSFKRAAAPLTAGLLLLSIFVAANFWGFSGFPQRIPLEIRQMVSKVDGQRSARLRQIRHEKCNLQSGIRFERYRRGICGAVKEDRVNVLVIGDSHGADTLMMLNHTYKDIRFSQATAGSCPPLIELPSTEYSTCQKLNDYRFSVLAKRDFDLVVLAANWNKEQLSQLSETINYLERLGRRVLVIGPRIRFSESVPLLVSQQISMRGNSLAPNYDRRLLPMMREAIPNTTIVDMARIQCDPECFIHDQSSLFYWDSHHFTPEGAAFFGKKFSDYVNFPGLMETQIDALTMDIRIPAKHVAYRAPAMFAELPKIRTVM